MASVSVLIVGYQAGTTVTTSKLDALHLTNADGRSVQISNYAAPILRSEVLNSQSARVSNVGGATYTTQTYLTSVQSSALRASPGLLRSLVTNAAA
ncbi:hypothetical protein ADILRU_0542 [Leifsonia rubra CMS 76R]|nr:hypothetical protein ADILRU_0542 [Leifsonia rubra CMS 76R]